MNKRERYNHLVKKRKEFIFQSGLINPSATKFDSQHIEPWAQWHSDLDADIMVIGQEFCDHDTFVKTKGEVERNLNVYEYPSNANLARFLQSIGRDPGHPKQPNDNARLFFTNSVMALKEGKMSANFRDRWINESRVNFLEPLIEIVAPRVIICIGSKALLSVSRIFRFPRRSLKEQINANPIRIGDRTIFSVYHTGGLGLRNRVLADQMEDWSKIASYL